MSAAAPVQSPISIPPEQPLAPPPRARAGALSSVIVSEGQIKTANRGQPIDYQMLSSCFTITATLKDGSKIAAHFALLLGIKDEDQQDRRSPKELIKIFKQTLQGKAQAGYPLKKLDLIGNFELWPASYLGLAGEDSESLAVASQQDALAAKLGIQSSKPGTVTAIDTSGYDYVYLKIDGDGKALIKEAPEGKG